ncbi:MAG: NADH-quinone oxidoreductase subunit K [Kineosporiaceae bacterium]
MIHLAVPVVLAAALAGIGVYALVARRHLIMVLVGAELLLNAVNLLLVTASQLPSGGLARLHDPAGAPLGADPLLGGQALAVFVITLAAAEIGLALAVVLLLFRARASADADAVTELGEASVTGARA